MPEMIDLEMEKEWHTQTRSGREPNEFYDRRDKTQELADKSVRPKQPAYPHDPAFTLRKWLDSDTTALAKHLNNKRIWDNCRDSLPFPYLEEDARAFISHVQSQPEQCCFCIASDEGEAIGNIGFTRGTDVERYNAELGYWLAEPYWGRGITTAALSEAVAFFFAHTDVERIHASVFEDNVASIRVLEKTGFRLVGVCRRAFHKNNRFLNGYYYELVRDGGG